MPSDWGPRFEFDQYAAALAAAIRRIRSERRRITVEAAEQIVAQEFDKHGVEVSAATVAQHAKFFHRGPLWPLLHPRQAKAEGYHIDLPWRRAEADAASDPFGVPSQVDAAAQREAWRQTGKGAGPLSGELEPAMCQRISQDRYFCVANIRSSESHAAFRVEITIEHADGGDAHVLDSELLPRSEGPRA